MFTLHFNLFYVTITFPSFRWYERHLEVCNDDKENDRVSIVLLTNDRDNKEIAQRDGIEVYTGKPLILLFFVVIKKL